jgi:hypothetical protein
MITDDGHCDTCGVLVPLNTMHYCTGTPAPRATTWPIAEQKEAVEVADYQDTKRTDTLNARLDTLERQVADTRREADQVREYARTLIAALDTLHAQVKAAFYEGWGSRLASGRGQAQAWDASKTKATLDGAPPPRTLAQVFAAEALTNQTQDKS